MYSQRRTSGGSMLPGRQSSMSGEGGHPPVPQTPHGFGRPQPDDPFGSGHPIQQRDRAGVRTNPSFVTHPELT